jgi:hypothetical protein
MNDEHRLPAIIASASIVLAILAIIFGEWVLIPLWIATIILLPCAIIFLIALPFLPKKWLD